MKKEIWPRGYNLYYTPVIHNIIIYIGLFIFAIVFRGKFDQKNFAEFIKFAFAVIFFNTLVFCFELYKLNKSYKKRKERKWIMEHAVFSAEGKVLEIKEELIDYKGNIVSGSYLEHAECNIAYRLIVAYTHPADEREIVVESDLYMRNPKTFLDSAEIKVYSGKNAPLLVAVFRKK